MTSWHLGRSWIGHPIEDGCPCGQAPCGLVDDTLISPDCDQHGMGAAKTMRQIHTSNACPARGTPEVAKKEDHPCSPLCGASKAYGRYDRPWKHEPECPVRIAWKQETGTGEEGHRRIEDVVAERDAAVALLRAVVHADRDDAKMGYPNPGDSCIGACIGLDVMPFLSELGERG
jgi:hypothetical protein